MSWRVRYTKEAEKDLEDLDNSIRRRVMTKLDWLPANFDKIKPEGLSADLTGFCKLRVGDWRMIYNFSEKRQIITIFTIKHRSRVYYS